MVATAVAAAGSSKGSCHMPLAAPFCFHRYSRYSSTLKHCMKLQLSYPKMNIAGASAGSATNVVLQVLPYEPVPCKQCGGILNPYASVDFYGKIWVCPICYTRCHFPPHYQGISEQNVPAELYPQYTTVEYTLTRTVPLHPPTYLFVVDTCVAEDELQACKSTITQVQLHLRQPVI